MEYTSRFSSPLGGILAAADELGVTGLWFEGQKYFAQGLAEDCREGDLPVFDQVGRWLEAYFSGSRPRELPPLHPKGTGFQQKVWAALAAIPYGETVTYGELARRLGGQTSARAVGGAVGRNRISLLIPCHRVVGAVGSLTGYAGGVERKAALLRLERGEGLPG